MKRLATLAIAFLATPTFTQEPRPNRLDALDAVSDTLATVDGDVELFVEAATAANQSQTLAAFADLAEGSTANSAEIQSGYETVENYGSRVRIVLARAARTARDNGLEPVAQQLHRGMSCLELRDTADSEIALIRQKDLTSITKVASALDRCLCLHRVHLEQYAGVRKRDRRTMDDRGIRSATVERIAKRPRDAIRLALFNLREAVNTAQEEIVAGYNQVDFDAGPSAAPPPDPESPAVPTLKLNRAKTDQFEVSIAYDAIDPTSELTHLPLVLRGLPENEPPYVTFVNGKPVEWIPIEYFNARWRVDYILLSEHFEVGTNTFTVQAGQQAKDLHVEVE